jgi:hypothetical protein
MTALPRTRGSSANNWQILLTNNLNAAADDVYVVLTFFGADQTVRPFIKADLYGIVKTARRAADARH